MAHCNLGIRDIVDPEPSHGPGRRIGRVVNSQSLGRLRVMLIVSPLSVMVGVRSCSMTCVAKSGDTTFNTRWNEYGAPAIPRIPGQ